MNNTNALVAAPKQKTTFQTPIGELLHCIGLLAGLAIAVIMTVAWIGLLGYGLFKLL